MHISSIEFEIEKSNGEVTKEELQDALTNFVFMTRYAEPGTKFTWTHIATFLHYYDEARLIRVMEWLRDNGYIRYETTKKYVFNLVIHKEKL